MRTMMAMGLAALLTGCGGAGTSTTTVTTSNGTTTSTTTSTDSLTALTGGVEGSNDCSKNPDFAPVYAGGTIKVCSSAHFDATKKTSGSFSYTTPAAPAEVLAFSKEQATKSGLSERIASDKMYSAGEGTKRSLVVITLPDGSGTRATVNWTKAD